MPLLDPQVSAQLGVLQSLDDAIAYRLGKLTQPCPGCGPAARCDEHHHDQHLLTSYQDRYAAALSDALAGLDPDDVAHRPCPHSGPLRPTLCHLPLRHLDRQG